MTFSAGEIAVASAITLNGNGSATVAQLAILATLPHFTPTYTLTVDDTLANLAGMTGRSMRWCPPRRSTIRSATC